MCPHLWNETGSETRWSGNVYISKNETGNETRWSGSVPISLTKLGVRPGDQKVFQSLERNWEWDQVVRMCQHLSNETGSGTRWPRNWEWDLVIRMCPHLSNETGSETWWSGGVHISINETESAIRSWSGSVQISQTKLGVRPGDQKLSQSLERNWEWNQVIRKCPHPSNKTGCEIRWSKCVHISRTKLGVGPGGRKVSKSLARNWEWDQVVRKCLHLSNHN
jgi:hypothetical protein